MSAFFPPDYLYRLARLRETMDREAEAREARAVDLLTRDDAALIAAAPDLAATVEALEAEVAELRATLAADRGEPEGALPGWHAHTYPEAVCFLRYDGRDLAAVVARSDAREGWVWDVTPFKERMPAGQRAATARDAMRAADAARGGE